MRNIFLSLFTFLLLSLISCKENSDITFFNTEQSYVYFAYPNPSNSSTETQKYIDSISYSFALDEVGLTEKVIGIPVNIIGDSKNRDRVYAVKIDEQNTTIDKALISISDPIIRANKYQDTLYVIIKNESILQSDIFTLSLELVSNNEFGIGHNYNSKLKISITDQLTEPEWWVRWISKFGPYQREKYQLWIQMYYLGADPTPDIYGEFPAPYYYWNNMPFYPNRNSFPVTEMFVLELKRYLEANATYPGGDINKPRIYLP